MSSDENNLTALARRESEIREALYANQKQVAVLNERYQELFIELKSIENKNAALERQSQNVQYTLDKEVDTMPKLIFFMVLYTLLPLTWAFYWLVGFLACWAFHIVRTSVLQLANLLIVLPEQLTVGLLNQAFHLELAKWQWFIAPQIYDFTAPAGWIVAIGAVTCASLVIREIIKFRTDEFYWR